MGLKQLEPVVETIGCVKYYITPFPAFKAANLTGELASVLAPLLSAIAPLVSDNGQNLWDVDAGKAASAMAGCSALDGEKLEKLMRKLLTSGNIVVEFENENEETESSKLDADLANEIFCGDVQDMFLLCFHVIRLNFNGFFKKLSGLSGGAVSAVKKTWKIV